MNKKKMNKAHLLNRNFLKCKQILEIKIQMFIYFLNLILFSFSEDLLMLTLRNVLCSEYTNNMVNLFVFYHLHLS